MAHQIRRATNSDRAALESLMLAHAEFEGHELAITSCHQQLDNLENLPLILFMVELDSVVVGYMSLLKQFSTWDMDYYLYLDCLYLDETTRGLGIGQQLMQQAKSFAQQQSITLMQWQTPESNKGAIGFYRKLGATAKHKLRFFWEF